MGKIVGIEDSDGATVGSIVGMEVEVRPSPSSSLVPGEEVGKPRVELELEVELELVVLVGSTLTSGSELVILLDDAGGVDVDGVRVWVVMGTPAESISSRTETVVTIIVGSESVRLWPLLLLFWERAWWWVW